MVAVKSSDLLKRRQAGLISANVMPVVGVIPPHLGFRLEPKQTAAVCFGADRWLAEKRQFRRR
jgi:hypothetical protein